MPETRTEQSNHSAPRANRADQIAALVWLIGGVIVLFGSLELDFTADYGPGPGFLPFWLAIGVIIFSIALFANATFRSEETDFVVLPTRHAAYQLVLVFSAIIGLPLLAGTIGFIVYTGLLFFFLLFFVERKGWKFSLIMAIASPLVLWLIFELGLELRLPTGLLSLFK